MPSLPPSDPLVISPAVALLRQRATNQRTAAVLGRSKALASAKKTLPWMVLGVGIVLITNHITPTGLGSDLVINGGGLLGGGATWNMATALNRWRLARRNERRSRRVLDQSDEVLLARARDQASREGGLERARRAGASSRGRAVRSAMGSVTFLALGLFWFATHETPSVVLELLSGVMIATSPVGLWTAHRLWSRGALQTQMAQGAAPLAPEFVDTQLRRCLEQDQPMAPRPVRPMPAVTAPPPLLPSDPAAPPPEAAADPASGTPDAPKAPARRRRP